MHLEEGDASNLKTWVVGRLQDISDADSDVLADYVLALIRTDTPDSQLKLDVLESLEDFLKDSMQKNFTRPVPYLQTQRAVLTNFIFQLYRYFRICERDLSSSRDRLLQTWLCSYILTPITSREPASSATESLPTTKAAVARISQTLLQ